MSFRPRTPLALASVFVALGFFAFTAAPALAVNQTLTVSVTGPGSVSDNSDAISGCEEVVGTCEAPYEEGTALTLFASHSERTAFTGWEGCEAESGAECTLTIGASSAEVKATFEALPQQTLTVATEGSGAGTVTGTSPGFEFTPIECGNGATTCEATYNEGATIVLFANRATHSRFTGWSGCPNVLSESEYGTSECEVPMSEAREVKASFAAIPQQSLEVSVTGDGEVTSSPAGIACTASAGTCTEHFDEEGSENTVTLTPSPSPDNHFVAWSGTDAVDCGTGPQVTCELTMTDAKSVHAEFAPTMHKVSINKSGPGSVTSSPPGIDCGEDLCEAQLQEGSIVTLTAAPEAHSHVTWSGCTVSQSNPDVCELTIGAGDANVEASFQINLHNVTVLRTGLGSISAESGAISECSPSGGTCSGEYDEASIVILTATPHAHYHVEWGVGCSAQPTEDVCEVEIVPSEDQTVAVAFRPNMHNLTVIPEGEGAIHADSGAIAHCTSSAGTCSGPYIEAATVTLFATPGAGQAVSWSGCTSQPTEEVCEVQVPAEDTEVRASFSVVTHPLYIITRAGTGTGSVTCNGAPCAAFYPAGTELTILATPAPGSTFTGWSGEACSGTGACHLTLNATTAITATFNANPPPPVEEKRLPLTCRKGFPKRHGKCVRKPHHHHKRGGRK